MPALERAATERDTSLPTTTRRGPPPPTSPADSRAGRTMCARATERRRLMAVGTGDRAPEFDLEDAYGKPRVRLADFRGKRNVLLVFHPFAFTAVCREEALDLQANLESFDNAETDVVFVSCDTSAARQAWKAGARRHLHLRLRLLAARRRREGLRRLRRGDRGTATRDVPDRQGRRRDLVAREGRAAAPRWCPSRWKRSSA